MRAEFSKRTKVVVWNRSGGNCERCTAKLYPGKFHYHHVLEATLSGSAEVANCQCLCVACHSEITADHAPVIAKSNRVRAKHIGIRTKSRQSFPTNKNGPFRKKINGAVERRTGGVKP